MKSQEVMKLIEEKSVKFVDYKFVDFLGMWQHVTVPVSEFTIDSFEEGRGFDGSSIRGWQSIHESDMLLLPDPNTAMIDPFCVIPTLSIIGNVVDPLTKETYSRDPRNIAKSAENYLKSTKIADTAFVGPELEFFIFDDVRYNQNQNSGYYFIDSNEGVWNTGREECPNLGYKVRNKEGYFPVAPTDTLQDLRSEMVTVMQECGIHIECHHHEVATAGQVEIDMRFDSLVAMADKSMLYKYIAKNVAKKHGKVVTFMPKPLFGDNGSGMHVHQSLWKGGKPLFSGNSYAGLSEMALYYIGGLLKHAKSILAFSNPTMNSYKRLVPGFEAPVNLAYSSRNRSAAIRIPMYSANPKTKRIEFRCPDPLCNPYLAFSAMLMAGLDGIQNKIDPGQPMDKDIYDLPAEELKKIPSASGSLVESLKALEADHEYLLKGNVFSKDLIDTWINYKIKNEVQAVNIRPHPYEFFLYFDL